MIRDEELRIFRQECDAWLAPLGYSLHAITNTSIMYSHEPDAIWPWPIVECWFESIDGNVSKNCRLLSTGNLGLIDARIGPISLKHPSMKDFIAKLRYLSNCIQSSRTNPIAQHHIRNLQNDYEQA